MSTKILITISVDQKELLERVRDIWQNRLDRQALAEGTRGRVAVADLVRAGMRLIVEQEKLVWPMDQTPEWGGLAQPDIDVLFPQGDVFIQRTVDGRGIIGRWTFDPSTHRVGHILADNWRSLEEYALRALDDMGNATLPGEYPCPGYLVELADWS